MTRMYCIDCCATDFADTRIPGYDEFEMLVSLLGGFCAPDLACSRKTRGVRPLLLVH